MFAEIFKDSTLLFCVPFEPLTVMCVCVQPEVCEWQSWRHSQDLALPATRVEERHFRHGCQAAWVREETALHDAISVSVNCFSVSCLMGCPPAGVLLPMAMIKPSWWWPWWPGTAQIAPSSQQCQTTCSKCGVQPLDSCCMFYLWVADDDVQQL